MRWILLSLLLGCATIPKDDGLFVQGWYNVRCFNDAGSLVFEEKLFCESAATGHIKCFGHGGKPVTFPADALCGFAPE